MVLPGCCPLAGASQPPPAPEPQNVNEPWPKPGGVTASIRLKPELSHGANAGAYPAPPPPHHAAAGGTQHAVH